jgi:hypothetical protein
MKFYDIDQNSEEWNEVRMAKFTASMHGDLFADKKTATYQKAITKVAYEKVTGMSEEIYSNKWMERGHEREPIGVENYELYSFNETENGGFYEFNEFVGASPDRKIKGKNAGVEIKCPSFNVYNEYLQTKKLPKIYFWQVHGQMLCTGWDYIDFMPFSHPKLKQVLVRVERDKLILEELEEKLYSCIKEVKQLIEIIQN